MHVAIVPAEPRESRYPARGRPGPPPPRLKPVDAIMFVLLSNRNRWYLVDTWAKSQAISATAIALRRRGCEVFIRHFRNEIRGYARWTHDIPRAVAPAGWEPDPELDELELTG